MKQFLFFLYLATLFVHMNCRGEKRFEEIVNENPPPIVKFKQLETDDGYIVEGIIPWASSIPAPQAGHVLGLDFLLVDDDDGGLRDTQMGWQLEVRADSEAVPADFGKIRLVEDLSSVDEFEVSRIKSKIEIDGFAEDTWSASALFPIEKLIIGNPENSEDFSASFRAYWDSLGLYLLIEVRDDKKVVDSRVLRSHDDGISIFIDAQNTGDNTFDRKFHTQMRLLRSNLMVFYNDFITVPKWTIPQNEVFDGGPGKDGIPSLENPIMVPAGEADYLLNSDLILGIKFGSETRAYPHKILDWHEIINDEINGFPFAVTYCPLTGTGIGWEREIDGQVTTFGVSGLLYNTNLIPYDRLTESSWTQIGLDCVNGPLQGRKAHTVQLVETSWKNWKEMYPQTKVVSTETGFGRDYNIYPYGNYKTDHSVVLFPISPDDDRLPRKTRVHGVIINNRAKVFNFGAFEAGFSIITTAFEGEKLVVAGSKNANLIVSFYRTLDDGTQLDFTALQGGGEVIMKDNEGNEWNIFGEAVRGPRQGQKLTPVESFMGYWMAFGSFYPKPEI